MAPQLRISPTIKTAVYDDIEIRMGPTAQTVPTTNWATNNPKPTTVYRGPLRVTFERGKWRGMNGYPSIVRADMHTFLFYTGWLRGGGLRRGGAAE